MDEVDGIITGLHKESDRTAAIAGASLVESVLQELLITSFRRKSADLLPRLFENRGPLSDFNSKILVAEAFGVIGTQQAAEIQRIRHIRNCFAHARLPVSFSTKEIATEVQDFIALIAMKAVNEKHQSGPNFSHMSDKASYVLICHIVMIMLEAQNVKLGGRRMIGSE